jgi:uncharacterized protein YxjI
MSELLDILNSADHLMVRQRRELAELFGFETRNKYAITLPDGRDIGFAAEQQKGLFGAVMRQLLGHWRTFEIHLFDSARQLALRAVHPFRFFFQRLEVYSATGQLLGALQQRFALLSKRFDVLDAHGRVLMSVRSPFWRLWSFPFEKAGREVAVVEKKWTGLLAEVFTDKDTFRVGLSDSSLSAQERQLVLAASLFVDLQYFEHKAD